MEEAAKLLEKDPKLTYEMHEDVASDCEQWNQKNAEKENRAVKQMKNLSQTNKGKSKFVSYFKSKS